VRVLLACSLGGSGHLEPVAAFARAVRACGHDPLVLVPPSLVAAVERTGLPHVAGEQPPAAVVDEIWERMRAGPPEAVRGLIDRELFAERCTPAMLPAARRTCERWQPGLVVRDPTEYASAVAALEAGIPHAQVGLSLAALEADVLAMVAPIVGAGVAGAIRAAPYLSRFPASLDPSPWPDTRRYREPAPSAGPLPESGPDTRGYREPAPPARPLPDWWPGDDRPLVYVTFGSVTGHLAEASGVYRAALDAVAALPARVLLTVGRGFDATLLGTVPANARVEPWVPQADVLPHAAVVVCHGGAGTTLGALAAGVPLVVCPLFADQPVNGRLVEAAGAGLLVRPGEDAALRGLGPADVAPLRAAVERVVAQPAFRRAAERVADEMASLPALDDVVRDLTSRAATSAAAR
jgi:UDP:flavonoid glycosyltransferase YjiC (YdhE family)